MTFSQLSQFSAKIGIGHSRFLADGCPSFVPMLMIHVDFKQATLYPFPELPSPVYSEFTATDSYTTVQASELRRLSAGLFVNLMRESMC